MLEETPEKSLSEMVVAVEEEHSILVRSHSESEERERGVLFKKVVSVEEGELSRSFSDNSDGFFSRRTERKRPSSPDAIVNNEKYPAKNQQSYNYPYRIPMQGPFPQTSQSETMKKDQDRFKEGRNYTSPHPEMFKGHQEGYASPGYYYPPYGYPPMYDPQYGIKEKEHGWASSADKGSGK